MEIVTKPIATKTPTHYVSPLLLLRRRGYFIPFVDVHLRSGEQVSRTIVFSDPAPGEGE
jgi:hypothetical protein